MGEAVDERPWWDTGTIDEAVADLAEESARLILRESWLASVMGLLRDTRRRAELTQAALAGRLGKKQSHISRLERSDDTTLGQVWDYLYACGEAPLDIATVPVAELREYVVARPGLPRTEQAVASWRLKSALTTQGLTTARPRNLANASIFLRFAEEDEDRWTVGPYARRTPRDSCRATFCRVCSAIHVGERVQTVGPEVGGQAGTVDAGVGTFRSNAAVENLLWHDDLGRQRVSNLLGQAAS